MLSLLLIVTGRIELCGSLRFPFPNKIQHDNFPQCAPVIKLFQLNHISALMLPLFQYLDGDAYKAKIVEVKIMNENIQHDLEGKIKIINDPPQISLFLTVFNNVVIHQPISCIDK